MSKKKVLVTGGCGFLCSHLVDRLLSEGHFVIALDNLMTSAKDNIKHNLNNPNFEFIRWDVRDPIKIEADWIFSAASPASPKSYQLDPVKTINTILQGSINALEMARENNSRIMLFSTSEAYGNSLQHPQKEEYWGNVNPIGPRSCYDEGKRAAECIFMDYHRNWNVDIRIVRIFNSLTGDQKVIYYKNGILNYKKFEECYDDINNNFDNILVPCFGNDKKYYLKPISGIHRHRVTKKGYKLTTTWGRNIKLTEDHGVFTLDNSNEIVEVFVKDLKKGDKIAIPNKLPFYEIPLLPFKISNLINIDVRSYNDDLISINGSNKKIKNSIENINEFLWFLGFFVSEGSVVFNPKNSDYIISFYSDTELLEKAKVILKNLFAIDSKINIDHMGTSISIRNRIIFELIINSFNFGVHKHKDKIIPEWLLQLPPSQLSYFLKGVWDGDGNHNSKDSNEIFIINSSSRDVIEKICLCLLKFGIVASIQEFMTSCRKGEEKKYKSFRLHVGGLKNYNQDITNCIQFSQRLITEDLRWSTITRIEEFDLIDEYVYDFSVEGYENFVGGDFIACHNTYGPRMQQDDGRFISNFICQGLLGKNLTVYGNGKNTRSICFVSDTIDGILKLMNSDYIYPVNIGADREHSVLEIAEMIISMINPKLKIDYLPLPQDDPTRRCPDLSLSREILGYSPKIPIEEGLQKTIQYFRSIIQC